MSTEGFSSEISSDLVTKYDEQASIGADITGGIVASVADFAASTWNSLTPESLETSTEDLLSRIDSNALRVYNEHPDTIHTASFVGGMLVPMGLAFKGMKAARAGVSGANFFSEAGQVAQKTKIAEAFINLGQHSNDYKAAVRGLYAAGLANVAIDNVAFDATMLLTMNAHPFMEDYVKNPVENFTRSMLLGMAIGGPLGAIGDRAIVKGIRMGAEQTAEATVRLGQQAINTTDNLSQIVNKRKQNIDNWQDMLDSQVPRPYSIDDPENIINPLTKNMLDTYLLKEKTALAIDLDSMISPEMRLMPEVDKAQLLNRIISDPARFAGVDRIRFATAKEDLGITFKEAKGLSQSTKEVPTGLGQEPKELDLPLTTKGIKNPESNKSVTMIYSPRFDAFLLSTDLQHYGTAADLVKSPEALLNKVPKNYHLNARVDQILENAASTTSYVDADFLRSLKYYDELDTKVLTEGSIVVSSDDISVLNALNSRIQKETLVNPDFVTSVKIKVESTAGKSEVDSFGIFDLLNNAKNAQLKSLMAQGVPFETISLHTNIPLETVQAFAASGVDDILLLGKPISTYTEAAQIPMHLANKERALALNTNLNKVPLQEIKASLMKKEMDFADESIKDAFLLGSKSTIAKSVGIYGSSMDTKARTSLLRSELTNITDSSVSGRMYLSADHALRDLGALGAVVTYIGKDTVELVNKQVAKLWEPMKPYFNAIAKDQVKTTELSTAMAVNAGLKGYREFKNGGFLVQDELTPWIEIKNAAGKVIKKERNMIPVKYNGQEFRIVDNNVQKAVEEMQKAGRELYEMRKTLDTIYGRPPVNDIGFWVPPFNPRENHITYVWDMHEDKTTLLFGKTEGELQTAVNAFTSKLKPGELGQRYEIIDKSNQKFYNISKGRHDNIFMTSAKSEDFHSGASAPAIVSTNTDVLVDLANGYDHYVGYGVRSLMDAQLSDVMARLDDISYLSQKSFRDQPLDITQKQIQKPHDAGTVVRNTIMGVPSLNQSELWMRGSELAGGVFNYAFSKVSDLFIPVLEKGKNILGKGKVASDVEYENLITSMKAKGIVNPFEGMDEHLAKEVYHVQQISQAPNITPRLLAISNGLAATVMLRFGELAHPIVNMLSMPILTSLAMGRKLDNLYVDGVLNPNAKFGVIETMFNGARYRGSVDGRALMKEAESIGLFKPIVSEATEALSQSRSLQPGIISKAERFLNKLSPLRSASDKLAYTMSDKLLQMLVKPADLAETITREQAFITGAYMAKEAYPGISKAGQMTFARDFMDKAIGNYSSAQRPVMFQGTLGVAMGLFQTYMLTMAQGIYRVVEQKNWAALAKTLLLQSSIFGTASLPGFKMISEQIGNHFSEQNLDLITGTYRALPDWMANTIIYGLPANLGPSITSRGDVNPRIPDPFTSGLNSIPAINILAQTLAAGDRVVSAAFRADASAGRAMLEALSLQSISRPVARMSELLTGTAITSKGNIVAGPEEVWTVKSVFARTMGVRPIEEAKAREAIHMNTYYGSIDREARQKVTQALKTHIRNGSLTPEIVEGLGQEYMKTGTPAGWRGAINTAIGQIENPTGVTVRNYLKPNSPFNRMIDDLE